LESPKDGAIFTLHATNFGQLRKELEMPKIVAKYAEATDQTVGVFYVPWNKAVAIWAM
jgi:hypothetical protein